jgi:hypothetical protein
MKKGRREPQFSGKSKSVTDQGTGGLPSPPRHLAVGSPLSESLGKLEKLRDTCLREVRLDAPGLIEASFNNHCSHIPYR